MSQSKARYLLIIFLLASSPALAIVPTNNFKFLNYSDIQSFSETKSPNTNAVNILQNTLSHIFYKKTSIHKTTLQHDAKLNRDYLRVTQWNIERGFHIEQITMAINHTDEYFKTELHPNLNEKLRDEIKSQIKLLQDTDIFTLNEVDWGISRTDYKNIADEFSKITGGEYAFIAEFLEVSPELIESKDPQQIKEYKGLHGNAIVSKFPITSSHIIRLPVCYDWFDDEKKRLSFAEEARRGSSKLAVAETITTELRQGSRVALLADILLPNKQTITVISVHLENRTEPKCREEQMQVLLDSIKDNPNPVIMGGDLNNFEKSAEPTSMRKIIGHRIKDPVFLGKTALNYLNPYGLVINSSTFTVSSIRKHKDPTVYSIPIILQNKARKLFNIIQKFDFSDDNRFDFSGDDELSYRGKDGKLSDSNQRASKGFVDTFKFNRAFGVAYFKIDWFFIKPLGKHYIPAFGRTLKEFNYSYKEPLSDHNPLTVQVMI